jgi:hypothetical protein
MSKGVWAFVAGFILATGLAVAYGLRQEAKAALARAQHEQQLQATRDELQGFRARAARLAEDSGRLAISLTGARRARDAARTEARALALRLSQQGDTAGSRIVLMDDSAAVAERAACSLVVLNCEARAAIADSGLARAVTQLDSTQSWWRAAEHRAQPSFFRDVWRARAVTLPLIVATVVLALRR